MNKMKVIIFMLLVCFVASRDVGHFQCFGDWCNVENKHQFCSEKYRFCRSCEDIRDDCGTAAQPRNCTGYCQDLAVKNALKEKTKELEDSCLVLPMLVNLAFGNVNAPPYNKRISAGSSLKYECINGYRLEGADTNTCLGNDTWRETTLPNCLKKSDEHLIGFRYATITLTVLCALLAFILILCVIKLCRLSKEKNLKEMSRTNTDCSLNENQKLLTTQNPDIDNEDETSYLKDGSPSIWRHDHSNDISTPTLPTAPPEEDKDSREQPARNKPRGAPIITVKNNIIVNTMNNVSPQQNDGNDKTDNEETNVPNADVPPRRYKSIDMKMSTKVSDDNERLDRGTNGNSHGDIDADEERSREKKRQGTKPLPARAIVDEKAKDKEPQVVTTEEDGQSPTKESDPDKASANIGINGVTFAKSDINGGGKQKEVEQDGSIASVTLESEQDDPLAKVGFGNVTYQTTDIKMDELKSGY